MKELLLRFIPMSVPIPNAPSQHVDGNGVFSEQYATSLDAQDPLRHLRKQFLIPSKADLRATSLPEAGERNLYPAFPKLACRNIKS